MPRARKRAGGGQRWFGYTRIYANPDEPNHRKRVIVREDINPIEAEALREAARRVLEFGEPVGAICRDFNQRGIKPVAAKEWHTTSLVLTLIPARLAGFRGWQGQKYPTTQWPGDLRPEIPMSGWSSCSVILRGGGAVRRHVYLLSGLPVCPKCRRRLYYRNWKGKRSDSYACIEGPGHGCGGTAIKAELLEEYVTGAVLDALESPRVQEALRLGTDPGGTRRTELLAGIGSAQERRADARRDYAEGVIDREDWLDIRDRTEQAIATALREYDRLSGSVTVMSDIPAPERVRDAWESWNVSRKRAAIKAVLHGIVIKPLSPRRGQQPRGRMKDAVGRRDREMAILRQRVEFDWQV